MCVMRHYTTLAVSLTRATDVFIVVRPELNEEGQMGFRLGVVWREGVSAFKPELSTKLVPREMLRELLLAKGASICLSCRVLFLSAVLVLNGHLAAQKGPGLSKMYSRPRKYATSCAEMTCA